MKNLLPCLKAKTQLFISFLFVMICLLVSQQIFAIVYSSVASGNWNNMATWSPAGIPGAGDDVTVSSVHTVTLTQNQSVNNVTLQSATNELVGAFTLQVNGTLNSNNTSPNATIIGATTLIQFVGSTSRALFGTQWGATTTPFQFEVALTSNAVGTVSTNIKGSAITITSGTLDMSNKELRPDNGTNAGTLTIGTAGTLIMGTALINRTGTANTAFGSLTINGNGVLKTANITSNVWPTGITTNFSSTSTVEYNGVSQTVRNATYGNLTLSGSGTKSTVASTTTTVSGVLQTSVTLSSVSTSTLLLNGTFQINQGGFGSGPGTWTYGAGGTLIFNNTAGPYGPIDATHAYWPSSNGPTNVTVQNGGGINMGVARTVTGTFLLVTGTNAVQGTPLTLNGITQINGGNFQAVPIYGASSTLIYNVSYSTSNEWTGGASATPTAGSGVPANVTIQTGTLTLAGNRGVPGNIQVNSGTVMSLNTGDLYIGGNLLQNGGNGGLINNSKAIRFVNTAAIQTISATGGTVFFDYLLIEKPSGVVQLSTVVPTDVTINTSVGDVLQLNNAGALDLNGRTLTLNNAGGNIAVSAAGRTITSGVSGATLAITGAKTITGAGTLSVGANVTVLLTAGLDFGANLTTINGVLQLNGGGFGASGSAPTFANGSTLLINSGGFFDLHNGSAETAGWFRNVASTGVAQQGIPWNLTIGNNTSVRYNATNNDIFPRYINGNLSIGSGSSFTLGGLSGTAGDFYLRGNWSNAGTFTPNSRAVFFNGATGDQSISKTGGEIFDYLIIDKTAGKILLVDNITVNQTLTLTNGLIDAFTNSKRVIISNTGSVARTNGWVTGNLQKNVATGAATRTFEIGGAIDYRPVTIVFGNVSVAGDLTASVTQTPANHPQIASSGLNTVKTVLRYWTLTNTGISFNSYSADFTFVAGDISGGADPNKFIVRKYDGATWSGATAGTRTATTTQAAGFTSFSDFAIGEASEAAADYVSNGAVSTSSATNWLYFNGITNVSATVPPTSTNNVTIKAGHTLTVDQNFTVGSTKTFFMESATPTFMIVNPAKIFTVVGGADFNGQSVTIQSTSAGSGALGQITGTLSNATNVTAERYITAKAARKNIFITSPVAKLISQSWQLQTHITGPGTGGTICTTNNTTELPTANDNGFDATQTNNPSFFTYVTTNTFGNRWTTIPNTTGTGLTPGQGYRVIVRGARSQGCALLYTTPVAPLAVTLSATGILAQGNIGATIQGDGDGFNLMGNPYASEIDFDNASWASIRSANAIEQTYYTYNPVNSGGTYSVYNTGAITNATGYTNPGIIASGQSFFVRRTTTGPVTIGNFFQEQYKSGTAQIGLFRGTALTVTGFIRAGLQTGGGAPLDEIIVRFADEPTVVKDAINPYDALSINEGSQVISSLKGTNRLAIQTRPSSFINDTVLLRVTSSTQGNFKLSFTEYENFVAANIYLIDKFTGTEQDVKVNPVYPFIITGDAASQGQDRFSLVFRSGTILPVDFVNITAIRKGSGVEINWKVPAETNMAKYTAERSNDGRQFSSIGELKAKGNSTVAVNYSTLDAQPLNTTGYYRIKATNLSGQNKYSAVVKIVAGSNGSQLNFYPNPVKDVLNIVLGSSIKGQYSLRVTDAKGSYVLQRNNLHAFNNVISLNTASLSQGVYMLEIISADGSRETARFVK